MDSVEFVVTTIRRHGGRIVAEDGKIVVDWTPALASLKPSLVAAIITNKPALLAYLAPDPGERRPDGSYVHTRPSASASERENAAIKARIAAEAEAEPLPQGTETSVASPSPRREQPPMIAPSTAYTVSAAHRFDAVRSPAQAPRYGVDGWSIQWRPCYRCRRPGIVKLRKGFEICRRCCAD